MEAVCRSLVEYNIRVRDLGQLFVTCPALLTCRAEDIHQRVEDISQMLGAPTSKITKESCLANLISGAPGILADPDAMRRLQFLVGHSVDVLQSIRFLTLQLQVDSKGTLLLVASHPEILITGIAEAFEALLAVLPLQKAELKAVIRKHPITLGVDVERAGSVLKALRAGGMEDAEVVQLVRLAFLTKLLGVPAGSILGAPSLFFNRSVVSTIGPRFSFIKDCLPDSTATWAPTTLLRSSDEDFCELTEAPLEQYAIYKKQWQEANGRRFRAK
ncbi:hypothetical protein COCSUDRAFT_42785 [Coccomyxa subellipsoidea C-169]|uniref:Uncharacterized protein n=1 Tax=Coccomyxa subellipsoidea (strain C-169) TaxID=574566 RepID=I0YVS9_COCSC|nr:hypothetical protein COCSUDRAFT_42785 [Coccomyxa subellipsoidea C-169]EIE22498.1 hypothetical protein COCSUDRAFT_42785 [Coccomyxa subellipsoidea C-169]|eukprot:XP_005647042.1 hypothetical protein COCSUDRAFT_42785 [Coccomyxa subellipsoidea C-169]